MNDKIIIECNNLGKRFMEGPAPVDVLTDVNFKLARGEQVAILGTSGSGKSTLLHLLGGLDTPSAGNVYVDGKNLANFNETARGKLRNRALGFIYQFHHLLPEFSARENVAMPLLIRGETSRHAVQAADTILAKIGLAKRIQHKPGELSGGERQRVAIARALVTSPLCVLADEPTGNLDTKTASVVYQQMLEVNQELNTSFVVVTHDERLAAKMSKIYHLEHGSLYLV